MEWLTQPFKVTDKKEVKKGIYTNYYIYYDKVVDGKTFIDSLAVPKNIFESIPVGKTVQLKRVEFYHRTKQKYLDFISEVKIGK